MINLRKRGVSKPRADLLPEGGVDRMRKKLLSGKSNGLLAVLLVLCVTVAVADISCDVDEERTETDATGQWKYVLEGDGAIIMGANKGSYAITGDFVIPSELDGYAVMGIGEQAFDHFNMTRVTIPAGFISIGDGAFYECNQLTRVSIPASVTGIVGNPFAGCPLESIDLAADNPVYELAEGVLYDKQHKTLVLYPAAREGAFAIPDGVLRIGDDAFTECVKLTGVTIPGSVTGIGSMAFWGCKGLTHVTIPDNVRSIGFGAFRYCENLTSVSLPDGVTSIESAAFEACKSLTDVIIPDSVTSIGEDAFQHCSGLTSVVIPSSVTSIGRYAFSNCSSLTSVVIPDSVTSIDFATFSAGSSLTDVTIPDSVTSIGAYAFYKCGVLTSLMIPASVTDIGDDAFAECERLTLAVAKGSAAERYAQEKAIPHAFDAE